MKSIGSEKMDYSEVSGSFWVKDKPSVRTVPGVHEFSYEIEPYQVQIWWRHPESMADDCRIAVQVLDEVEEYIHFDFDHWEHVPEWLKDMAMRYDPYYKGLGVLR